MIGYRRIESTEWNSEKGGGKRGGVGSGRAHDWVIVPSRQYITFLVRMVVRGRDEPEVFAYCRARDEERCSRQLLIGRYCRSEEIDDLRE